MEKKSRPGGLSYRGNGSVQDVTKPVLQQRLMKHPRLTEKSGEEKHVKS